MDPLITKYIERTVISAVQELCSEAGLEKCEKIFKEHVFVQGEYNPAHLSEGFNKRVWWLHEIYNTPACVGVVNDEQGAIFRSKMQEVYRNAKKTAADVLLKKPDLVAEPPKPSVGPASMKRDVGKLQVLGQKQPIVQMVHELSQIANKAAQPLQVATAEIRPLAKINIRHIFEALSYFAAFAAVSPEDLKHLKLETEEQKVKQILEKYHLHGLIKLYLTDDPLEHDDFLYLQHQLYLACKEYFEKIPRENLPRFAMFLRNNILMTDHAMLFRLLVLEGYISKKDPKQSIVRLLDYLIKPFQLPSNDTLMGGSFYALHPYWEKAMGDDREGKEALVARDETYLPTGAIVKAHDTIADRPIAIRFVQFGPESVDQVIARAQDSSLSHMNLVQYLDKPLKFKDYLCFVMEPITGTLFHLIHGSTPHGIKPLEVSLYLATQLANQLVAALSYLHEKKLSYRKLTSMKVVYQQINDHDYLLKVTAAAWTGFEQRSSLTLINTDGYLAPELEWPNDYGPSTFASDVFNLGIVLWEIMCNVRPYVAHARDPRTNKEFKITDLARTHTKDPETQKWVHPGQDTCDEFITKTFDQKPAIPLCPLVLKMLRFDPTERDPQVITSALIDRINVVQSQLAPL